MNHVFSEVPSIEIPRSQFTRNHNLKTAIDVDYLYPIYVGEALPAETRKVKQHLFARLSTPVVPVMDNLYLDTFYFAVPIRLIDKDWQKFMGERPFGDTTTVYEVPMLNSGTGVSVGSLSDYLGIPPSVANLEFSAYWHRAYNLIYNEWFRDENLCPPVKIAGLSYDGTQSTENLSDYQLLRRGKRHDYFTSCLPWPQKGETVTFGMTGQAPVYGNGLALPLTDGVKSLELVSRADGTSFKGSPLFMSAVSSQGAPGDSVGATLNGYTNADKALGVPRKTSVNTPYGLVADMTGASAVSINALREAISIQHLLEASARTGSRYIEILRGMFGCVSPDARMQRPEYLGGGSVPVNITTVAQTSSTDTTSPQGNLAAFGTVSSDVGFTKSFTEHCIILGLANVRADLSYQQGLPRMFSRRTRYDFYWPQLANLGEQAVLNKEIYAQGSSVTDTSGAIVDDKVFGYQERWAEYRYSPNMITGIMRSTAPQSLDVWHLAQHFTSLPTLSQGFIEEHVPIDRVLAVNTEPAFIVDGWFEEEATLPMPLYSVPGLRRL